MDCGIGEEATPEGTHAAANLSSTDLASVEQTRHTIMPPETLPGIGVEWRLQRFVESPSSPTTSNSSAKDITPDEERLIATLQAQENDGLYGIKMRQDGDVLVRLYCKTPECHVKAKVIRWHGKLCLYTQQVHQNHLKTPQKGLKKPALRYVQENQDRRQTHLLQELKERNIHNNSWNDDKNKRAIKNAKSCAKINSTSTLEQGEFSNLEELSRALDAHQQPMQNFLFGPQVASAGTGTDSTSTDRSPLRNVVVLHHDVGQIDNGRLTNGDWSEIIVTVPSARKALQKATYLWGMGHVQQEADYSQGLWKKNLRQVGMVGISDAE